MSSTPTISVVIPFYNNQGTLLNAIRSVFAQTFEDWELILADDGSTDRSLEIARSIQDPRVRTISDGRNLKLAGRLNEVHPKVSGKYIARMDADDLMHPDRLRMQVEFLEEHPQVDVVGTQMYSMDADYQLYGVRVRKPFVAEEFEPAEALERTVLAHATIAGKAQWFRDNPYDETWPRLQDAELFCRTCRHSNFAELQTPLYFCNEVTEEMLSKGLRAMHFRRCVMWKYGPGMVGWFGTLSRVSLTYVKSAVYWACRIFNTDNLLVQRATKPLDRQQRQEAEATLEDILNTDVPARGAEAQEHASDDSE